MMKKRDPIMVVILSVITIGIYAVYWFYKTSKSMIEEGERSSSPILWTIGLLIPIVNIIVLWKYSHLLEEITEEHEAILIFLLWLVFNPAAIYVTQKDLNKYQERKE